MSISSETQFGKATQLAANLEGFVKEAVQDGKSLHDVEQKIHQTVLQIGHEAMKMFLSLQTDGDPGETGSRDHRTGDRIDVDRLRNQRQQ